MLGPIAVQITDAEWVRLRRAAERLCNAKGRDLNYDDGRPWLQQHIEITFQGFLGEYAVAKHWGLPAKIGEIFQGNDGGWDLAIPRRGRFDVKYADRREPPIRLIVEMDAKLKDGLILTGPSPDNGDVLIWGWITTSAFMARCRTSVLRRGTEKPKMWMFHSLLLPAATLIEE
jgi:hypothetical protein